MKIMPIKTYRLYGQDHFLFMTEVKSLIASFGSNLLNIDSLFRTFSSFYEQEHSTIQSLGLSPYSAQLLEESDKKRDDYYWAIGLIIKANTKHIDEKIRNAAGKIEKILDRYGNLRYVPYEEETIQLNRFCRELNKYPGDLGLMHLNEWIKILNDENEVFKDYYNAIKQEMFFLNTGSMKTVRLDVDNYYKEMISKIEALSVVEGVKMYEDFIYKLNAIINNYVGLYSDKKEKEKKATTNSQQPPIIPESFY